MKLDELRVLVVHEWLYTWAGAERALEQILEVFPQAELLVGAMTPRMRDYNAVTRRARESWVGRVPGARTYHRWFLPLHAAAFAAWDTTPYDLVISSSHAFEKFITRPRAGVHLCYCYSPPRFLWDLQSVYEDQGSFSQRSTLRFAAPMLRQLDRSAAANVDHFVSISRHVAGRVKRCYDRDSAVVYPPVAAKATAAIAQRPAAEPFLLSLGRLVPYKRTDLVIEAAERAQVKLIVAGDGPERARLERMAGSHTEFVGEVSEARAAELLEQCAAFAFAGEEDFGIALVEANAHGKPVICYGRGGATESMIPDVTATFFERQHVDNLVGAIGRCLSRTWDEAALRENARRFSPERFRAAFSEAAHRALGQPRRAVE